MESNVNRGMTESTETSGHMQDELNNLKSSFNKLRSDVAELFTHGFGLGRDSMEMARGYGNDAMENLKERGIPFRLAGSATAPRPPINGGDFQPPRFGEITSSSIRASVRPKQLALALMMTLASTIGVIAGSELHRRSLFAACFAILAVVAGHAFASVPHWRHRDG